MRATISRSLEGGGVGFVVGQAIRDRWGWLEALLCCRVIVSSASGPSHCGLKVSEERLVGIRCCSVFSGVKLPMQAPRCFCCHTRETDLRLTAGFWLHCEKRTDSDTFHLSRTSLYILYISYISYISYIRPFLVVVLQQRHVKNVTINIAGSVGQTHAQNLTRSGGKRFAIHSMGSTNGTTRPVTRHCDSQIYARNPKGPVERDLICQARAEVLSTCSHEIPKTVPGGQGLSVADDRVG